MTDKKTKRARDLNFVFYTAIFALMFMAFMFELRDILNPPPPEPGDGRVMEAVQQIKPMEANAFAPLLRGREGGGRSLLFIYASWCGYCRTMMPGLVALQEQGKLGETPLHFLSIDQDVYKLARYLAKHGYDTRFAPYMAKAAPGQSFGTMLAASGSSFSGAIPYLAAFDHEGRVVEEEFGVTSMRRVEEMGK